MNTQRDQIVQAYIHDLHVLLNEIPLTTLTSERKAQIVRESAAAIDWDRLIADAGLAEADLSVLSADVGEPQPMKFKLPKIPHIPIPHIPIPHIPLPGKTELCIIKTMAIASALIAAWVASGGTLAVGTVGAGGVIIEGAVLQALVAGASAATLAKIICEK